MFFVLCVVVGIAIAWLLLMASGALSLRWSRRYPRARPVPRLVLAVVPVLAGAVLLGLHLRFTINQSKYDLSMPFVFPVTLGLVAVIAWFRARENTDHAPEKQHFSTRSDGCHEETSGPSAEESTPASNEAFPSPHPPR